MKETMRFGFTLALICMIAAGLLAGMNFLTRDRILAQAQAEEEASLKAVMPQAEIFEPVKSGEEIIYFKAYDTRKQFIGVAFKASGKGYSSSIETMVGMLKDGTLTAVKILAQNETPGLGSRVAEAGFTGQFSRKKDLSEIQAITGATISSNAVIDSVRKKAKGIQGLILNGK